MDSNSVRKQFLDFFEDKGHKIVPSAPMVNKDDPSLMFINAGMNPFKDFFLGNKKSEYKRIADAQKCLRVSGKHNDLEEVGLDSYHHTMFEMLGNWSIGDYFKEEAINMAWELLTEVFQLEKDRLYVTVFEGNKEDGLGADTEAEELWKIHVKEERILRCDKKDNFWEMGEQGPCGPCSEIHIDLRSAEERTKIPGAELVNKDHPLVIEIWNLVFIQFNRKANGDLEELPEKHIDTGMGLERLVMALQGKKSNYETDIFSSIIEEIEKITGKKYGKSYAPDAWGDIAFRVLADHLRAVVFGIADGEMPGNTGAGYVLRRILRRAIRYYYSFLDYKKPLASLLVSALCDKLGEAYPEIKEQEDFITRVIEEEEKSFLRTLSDGLKRMNVFIEQSKPIDGQSAFELYDTFGFPIDLTALIASQHNLEVDISGFEEELRKQKDRSRSDQSKSTSDWQVVHEQEGEINFVGYDEREVQKAQLLRYRKIEDKEGVKYQLVFDRTPFYAESGGQVGDTGSIQYAGGVIEVLDTQKENDLIIHWTGKLPEDPSALFELTIDQERRKSIVLNHSATHLLHAALRQVLGTHVKQRGSLVREDMLRFDFSHFEKMTEEEIRQVETIVNDKIRDNIQLQEDRSIPIAEAREKGAMMLFGEKYGDHVRMITFDPTFSRELCGGCHVERTGDIGLIKILSESGIASGVRRIEAVSGSCALDKLSNYYEECRKLELLLKSPDSVMEAVQQLISENKKLNKEIEGIQQSMALNKASNLLSKKISKDNVEFLIDSLDLKDPKQLKPMLFDLESKLNRGVIVLAANLGEKVQLGVILDKELSKEKDWHAGKLVKEWSSLIRGGGGGQPFFAVAGGSDPSGIQKVLDAARDYFGLN